MAPKKKRADKERLFKAKRRGRIYKKVEGEEEEGPELGFGVLGLCRVLPPYNGAPKLGPWRARGKGGEECNRTARALSMGGDRAALLSDIYIACFSFCRLEEFRETLFFSFSLLRMKKEEEKVIFRLRETAARTNLFPSCLPSTRGRFFRIGRVF